jgi:vacuolar-type H+-ATPase subunit E/Vma4
MALADLLLALQRDADAEVHAIETAASEEAARIDADAAQVCAARLAAAVRELAVHEQDKGSAHLADVERRHRRVVLEARAAMLARLNEAIRACLPGLVDPPLRERFAAAAATYGEGTRRDLPTGVVVDLPDGPTVEVSLDSVLDGAWPRLAGEALRLIEEQAA